MKLYEGVWTRSTQRKGRISPHHETVVASITCKLSAPPFKRQSELAAPPSLSAALTRHGSESILYLCRGLAIPFSTLWRHYSILRLVYRPHILRSIDSIRGGKMPWGVTFHVQVDAYGGKLMPHATDLAPNFKYKSHPNRRRGVTP